MDPQPDARPVAELSGVSRTYRRGTTSVPGIVDVDLVLHAGEWIAIVGPSGCGKSTLLNVLAGVDRPDRGRVLVAGHDLGTASERELVELRRHTLGVVFQAFHLMPNLSAADNVALPLALAGRSDPRRVRELLERVHLSDRAEHFPSELSGGQQQRVALARAVVHAPALVVADEPTGNLDSKNGAEMLALFDELCRRDGVALAIATHDEEVAARADRIVRMKDARIVGDDAQRPARPGPALQRPEA